MATVFFYNFILLSSTFFVWLSDKGHSKVDRWVLLGIAFLLVFIPSAIRYDIGTDYFSYLEIYENASLLESYKFKEPGFYFVNSVLSNIGAHFQWMFTVFAFIFTAVAFRAYPKNNAWLLHFLFFSMLWFFSFNGIRQAVALAWCLLAVFNFFERRYFTFFVLTFIASNFHQSALFITLTGGAALLPLGSTFKSRIAPIVFIGFIIFTFFSMNIVLLYMEQLLNIIGMTKYSSYFSNSKHFLERDFGSGLGILAKLIFCIYVIINTKHLITINKRYWLVAILTFVYALSSIIAMNIVIFERMLITFTLGPVIGAYLLFLIAENILPNRLALSFFLLLLLLSFVKDSFGIKTTYGDPKKNPYQTIFIAK